MHSSLPSLSSLRQTHTKSLLAGSACSSSSKFKMSWLSRTTRHVPPASPRISHSCHLIQLPNEATPSETDHLPYCEDELLNHSRRLRTLYINSGLANVSTRSTSTVTPYERGRPSASPTATNASTSRTQRPNRRRHSPPARWLRRSHSPPPPVPSIPPSLIDMAGPFPIEEDEDELVVAVIARASRASRQSARLLYTPPTSPLTPGPPPWADALADADDSISEIVASYSDEDEGERWDFVCCGDESI